MEEIDMSQVIKDLWNGNLAPVEHCGLHDPAVNNLIGLIERNRKILSGGLTEAQMEVFQKYLDCTEEYLLCMMELAFCDGFSLGSKLTIGALL